MLRTNLARVLWCASLLAVCAGSPGCGGGGGGGGGPAPCTIPGSLVALALEGQATPAGGNYAPFLPDSLVSAGDGGWVAFVAGVLAGSTTEGLFVARPNGTVVLVYAKDETVPTTNGGTGTIDDFERIWMRPGGVVVTHVEISSGSGEGFLTARVDNAGVVEKAGSVYLGRVMPASPGSGPPGALTAIDEDLTQVDDQGSVFFHGTGTGVTPLHGVWTCDRSGGPVVPVAVTGEPAPGGGTFGFGFEGLGLDADGTLVALEVDVIGGPTDAIIATTAPGTHALVAATGNSPPNSGGRTFEDVYDGGPLIVTAGAGQGFVTWRGDLTGASPDHGVFTRQVLAGGVLSLGPLTTMMAPGQALTNFAGVGSFASDVQVLFSERNGSRVTVDVSVSGGTTQEIFFSFSDPITPVELWREGSPAPEGSTFGTVYPSVDGTENDAVNRDGDVALTAVLQDASSGVFWGVISCDLFAVARQGDTAPGTGGGAFGSFSAPSTVSTANTVVAFVSFLLGGTAPSGLFRQN